MGTQSVITLTISLAGGRFTPGHLGELTQLLPFEMVDEALRATGRVQARLRDLPSRVVVYLILAACLFTEVGYSGVWRKLTGALAGLPQAAPTASAPAQARQRVGSRPLQWLFDLLRGPAAIPHGPGTRWRGLLVVALDGTTLTVPHTPAVLTRFTRQAGNHGGTGYPQIRLLALVACGTRTIIDAVFGPTTAGETTYTPRLLPSLRPGMILLADRDFAAQGLLADIADTGAQVLVRLLPERRLRVCPRIVKRAISKYQARGPRIDRTSYEAATSINILTPPLDKLQPLAN
ncbi:IS4 family transposase [Nonomuraea sp. NPDC047897]|uniref:IS4 family transposase n=1 Tax=Nonomuraea sp. NPDC047897 TaxID=3364346 RepID=UPI003718BD83